MNTKKQKELAEKTIQKLQDLGWKDDERLNEIEKFLDEEIKDSDKVQALENTWLRPEIFLAGALGSLLSGALSPGEFAIGTTASIVASVTVEKVWTAIRRDSTTRELPEKPSWRYSVPPSVEDRRQVDSVIRGVAKASVSWASTLSEQERRMEAAHYRIVSRNIGKPGPIGFAALASI